MVLEKFLKVFQQIRQCTFGKSYGYSNLRFYGKMIQDGIFNQFDHTFS